MVVQAPRVRASVPVAEKYITQRTQSFTRTHAGAMQEWIDTGGSEADYYKRFRENMARTEAKWEEAVRQIDADPNMNFREKRDEKTRLTRIWPAWSEKQEAAFIRVYGDPREVDRGRLEGGLTDLQSPQWDNAMRQGQMRIIPKHEWEKKFHDALASPQDGSVPLALEARAVNPSEPAAPASKLKDARKARFLTDVEARMCAHCGKQLPTSRGTKRHEATCKENPVVAIGS